MIRSWGTCVVVAVAAMPTIAVAERAVTGTVVDDATGLPVADAVVSIADRELTTDATGGFVATGLPAGPLQLVVVADGYAPYFHAARPGARLVVRLTPDDGATEFIRISGRAPDEAPIHLDAAAIRTQPGAGNDVLRALQGMPGVARTPFGLGGLALRGTAPRDTKVFLDGIEVPILYHFGGLASFMPTAAVEEVSLEPSGASARFGRGLGGVAIVTSRAGRRDRTRVGGEISLIHAAAIGEAAGPAGGNWLVGVRRSYFDAIIRAANLDLVLLPRYFDAQVRWESGDRRWMAILFGSDDQVTLQSTPEDAGPINTRNVKGFSYTSRFVRLGVRYQATRGATRVMIQPSAGFDDIDAHVNHNDVDKGLQRTTVPVALRAEVTTVAAGGELGFGLDGGWLRHAYDARNTPPPTPTDPSPDMVIGRARTTWAADLGAWTEGRWRFARDRVELRVGLRGDRFGLSDQWTLDPRLVATARLAEGLTLTQTLGRYHAPPLFTDLDPIFGARTMPGSAAIQASTALTSVADDGREVSATIYYQDLRQLPVDALSAATPISANGGTESGGVLGISRELTDSQFGSYSYREAIGTGRAYGLELVARRSLGRLTGWVAYTFARSSRVNPSRDLTSRPYVLDQPHTLAVVGSIALTRRWRLGGRLRFTTGNPLTPVAGAYQDVDGDWVAVDGPLLSQRLPDFVQLDLRLDRSWHRAWGVLNLYIDLQNATNRTNVEGVTYNKDYTRRSYTTGLPIFPSIGVEYVP